MLYALCAMLVIQQVYWMKMTHQLIAKLMSRNYHEYKQSENIGLEPQRPRYQDQSPPEDLGSLQEFVTF